MRFLFIDRVTGLERGRRITGIKSFAATEPFLESHFTRAALVRVPPHAILPGAGRAPAGTSCE